MAPSSLHNMSTCGLDSCSSVSASTRRADFVSLDTSEEALESANVRGVGGGTLRCGGRGALIIQVVSDVGKPYLLVDPQGVYMIKKKSVPEFVSWDNNE